MKILGIEITHPDKILFPEIGATKLDVVQYYNKYAQHILKFLKDRPVSLVRNPSGVDKKGFYQKHPQESFPEYIERVKIIEKNGEEDVYITLDQPEDLIYLSNLNVIEYHAWLSTIKDLEHPDMLIFDLDPDPSSDWKDVIYAAEFIKSELEKLSFSPKLRVSGGKGLHIVADYKKRTTWEQSKALAKSIAERLCEISDKYLIELSKEKRKDKIFIDFYRNERGATAVVPYSLRSKPVAPICMEVKWDELNIVKPQQFLLRAMINQS